MGMSASQARLLTLTARMSDLELAAQQITNRKIRLATESQSVAEKYSNALNDKKLVFNKTNTRVTANNLTGYVADSLEAQRILKNSLGKVLVSAEIKNAYDHSSDLQSFLTEQHGLYPPQEQFPYYTNLYYAIQAAGGCVTVEDQSLLDNSSWLSEQLSNGNLFIEKWNPNGGESGNGAFVSVSYGTDTFLIEEYDTSNDAAAEAEYQAQTAKIQAKDKKLDNDLQQINTEHKALETEYDSVKKVIEKNIERSFKTFG